MKSEIPCNGCLVYPICRNRVVKGDWLSLYKLKECEIFYKWLYNDTVDGKISSVRAYFKTTYSVDFYKRQN